VAVDDHLLQRAVVIEERLANPAQVGGALGRQIGIGADASVDEGIVADYDQVFESLDERLMLGRHVALHRLMQLVIVHPVVLGGITP
jgi:hypothetical protein